MNDTQDLAYFGRGLTVEQFRKINDRLPDTHTFRCAVLGYNPSLLATRCHPRGGTELLPRAAVCLQDTSDALSDATYALQQALVTLEVLRRDDPMRISNAHYYVADAAHRVYAAGEHLAAGMLAMLGLTEPQLDSQKKDRRVSRQSKLWRYLQATRRDHKLTVAVTPLGASEAFRRTLQFRAASVHAQPPRVAGMGLSFDREAPRWNVVMENGRVTRQLTLRASDPTSLEIEPVVDDALQAVEVLTAAALEVAAVFDETVIALGVRVDRERRTVSVDLAFRPDRGA